MAVESNTELKLKLHHGGIAVPDLDASVAWYREILGFEVEARFTIPHIPAEVAMLRHGDIRIELFQASRAPVVTSASDPSQDVRTPGTKHVCFAVKDVYATAERFRQAGVDIVFVRDFDFDGYKGSTMYVRDNSGILIEFIKQPELFA